SLQYPAALRRRRVSARMVAVGLARRRRSDLSRPMAEAAALETALHPERERDRDRAHPAARRRVPFRNRCRGLCGLDAQTPDPLARLRMDSGARPGLASRVVRFFRDALRSEGEARRPCTQLSDLPQNRRRTVDGGMIEADER